jgi:DNA polymerase III sliding clamp (beta) subunit (PCNA family)
MKKELEIINKLTNSQRKEFDSNIEEIFALVYKKTEGDIKKLKDVTVNINLEDEVFLNVTLEFDSKFSDKGKGRITKLYQYPNKISYDGAVASEINRN